MSDITGAGGSPVPRRSAILRAMDDVRAELEAAEDEVRQQAARLRQRARALRLRGFKGLAYELEALAVALQGAADAIATELQSVPPTGA